MDLRFDKLGLTLRGRTILDGVSGVLPRGQVTVILGANGAGKSSLLSCLSGLRRPTSGEVRLGERALAAVAHGERARLIGLLPQQAEVHWDISVHALVALGRLPHHGRWGPVEADRQAVAAAMAATDVSHLAERKAQRLSGGEQARVLLARVLAGQPRWLLADEPLANLDPAHQLDALARLAECATDGMGVVAVLHDLTHAARVADQVVLMKQGCIIAAGPAETVLTPALIEAAFGITVHVGTDDRGGPIIVPLARAG
ncbi:MAG: ABC transporter ATP-binding protein [Novosphingobium sp.]